MRDPLPGEDPVMVRSDVLAVPLDDSLVLYDPAAARAHVLNRSAGRIWAVLQVPTSIDDAVTALVDGSDASAAVVEHDVRAAVDRFAAEQLLGPTCGPTARADGVGGMAPGQPGRRSIPSRPRCRERRDAGVARPNGRHQLRLGPR